MKISLLCLAVVGALTVSACHKRTAPAPVESPAKPETAPAPVVGSASGAAVATFAPEVVADAMKPFAKDLDSKSPNDHLRVLNEALTFWQASGRPFPKDLSELVTAKLLQRLPVPPPGKQFVLDRAKNQVVLVP
ncbi:MAG: hypothetical protein RL514_2192 [Verrucomicrobiota bacterium]|jgi:hypothetical protein